MDNKVLEFFVKEELFDDEIEFEDSKLESSTCNEIKPDDIDETEEVQKCGHVLLASTSGKFIFVCVFCEENFRDLALFENHIRENHHELKKEWKTICIENSVIKFEPIENDNQLDAEEVETADSSYKTQKKDPFAEQPAELNIHDNPASWISQLQDSTNDENYQDDRSSSGLIDVDIGEVEKQPSCIKKHSDLLSIDEPRNADVENLEAQVSATSNESFPRSKYDEEAKQPFCPVCCSSFNITANFLAHLQKKHSDVLNNDEILNSSVKHLETKLGATLAEITCIYCFQSFTEMDALRAHSSVHVIPHHRKMYRCKFCPKIFKCPSRRQIHMYIHEGVLPYKCDLCPAAYRSMTSLQKHLLVHASDKKVICKYCTMVFARKGERTFHERIHANELLFKCNECEKGFISRLLLENHMIVHKGTPTYKCDECGCSFNSLPLLEAHRPTHSNTVPAEPHCFDQSNVQTSNNFPASEQNAGPSSNILSSEQCSAPSTYIVPDSNERASESTPSLESMPQNTEADYEQLIDMYVLASNVSHIMRVSHSGDANGQGSEKAKNQCDVERLNDTTNAHLSGGEELKKMDKERNPFCSACSRCFNQEQLFRSHVLIHHSELLTNDEINNSSLGHLEEIVAKNSGEMRCAFCSMVFIDLETFRRHACVLMKPYTDLNSDIEPGHDQQEKHLKDRLHIYDNIHKIPREKDTEYVKEGEKMPLCTICGRCYKTTNIFRKHLRKKHSDLLSSEEIQNFRPESLEDKLAKVSSDWTCIYCFKKFNDIEEFREHSKPHMEDSIFNCKYCPKTFSSNHNRQMHINVHENHRPYKCRFCPRVFIYSSNRKEHEQIHSGSMTLHCKFCDKLFAKKSERTAHEKIHTNDFPYECSKCGMRFTMRMKLKNHILHRKCTRNLKCHRCGIIFHSMPKLKEHMQAHSNEQQIKPVAEKDACGSAEYSEFEIIIEKEDTEWLSQTEETRSSERNSETAEQIDEENIQNTKEARTEHLTDTNHDQNVGVTEINNAPFCPVCIRCFRSEQNLRNHLRLKHSNLLTKEEIKDCSVEELVEKILKTSGEMACRYCSTSFTEVHKLKIHLETHLRKLVFACKFCPKTFISKQKCDLHTKEHGKDEIEQPCAQREVKKPIRKQKLRKKPFCTLCIRCYPRLKYFRRHLARMHSEIFTKQEILKASVEELEEKLAKIPDEMMCIYCWKRFDNLDEFRVHRETHVGGNMFCCKFCPQTFGNRFARQFHMNAHEQIRPYKCEVCSMTFTAPHILRGHEQTHVKVKQIPCKYCDQTFTKTERIAHEQTHPKELPFECDQCGARFITKTARRYHVERHNGIKNYKCEQCEKAFYSMRCLKEHSLSHTDERPLKCATCGKTFKRYRNLIGHLHLHEKKKYVCEICSKAFLQSAALHVHMKYHKEIKKK